MSSFSQRHGYSRSSLSLARPYRRGSLTPVQHLECSSRSDTLNSSGGISEAGESPNSKSSAEREYKRASARAIVYAIANGTPIPGTDQLSLRQHWRTVSAPDVVADAQAQRSSERMAMGWKPNLEKRLTGIGKPVPGNIEGVVRSASAELLGRFGPMAAADDVEFEWKKEFEIEIENRLNNLHVLPFGGVGGAERKSLGSDDTLRDSFDRESLEDEMRFEDAKEVLHTRPVSRDIACI